MLQSQLIQLQTRRSVIVRQFNTFLLFFSYLTSQQVYYLLYADNYELPSKVAFDPEEPSLGRIQTDSILPPHTPVTIKRRISRVERTPAISYADLFADISCNTPLKEEHISFLRTDYPGLSAKEPMAIVLTPLAPLRLAPLAIPDGRYLIKNRAADVYWYVGNNPIQTVYFSQSTIEIAKVGSYAKVNEHYPIIKVFRG